MRTSCLIRICAAAATAQAALVGRQDSSTSSSCNATAVVTATSGTETYYEQRDTYVLHQTTTVTVLSLGAKPLSTTATPTSQASSKRAVQTSKSRSDQGRTNAPPGTYNSKRNLDARAACASPTTTLTTTVAATTTTVTTMHTLSRQARATVTAPACSSDNNYGLVNGTLNRNFVFGYGEAPVYKSFSNVTTEECCKKCFQSEDGCVAWSYGGTVNNTEPYDGCVMAMYDGGCPTHWGADTIVYQNEKKYPVGMGACNVQVAYFQG